MNSLIRYAEISSIFIELYFFSSRHVKLYLFYIFLYFQQSSILIMDESSFQKIVNFLTKGIFPNHLVNGSKDHT